MGENTIDTRVSTTDVVLGSVKPSYRPDEPLSTELRLLTVNNPDPSYSFSYRIYEGAASELRVQGRPLAQNTPLPVDFSGSEYRLPILYTQAAPGEVRVERLGGELRLSWEKPAPDADATYTVYYSLTDSIDRSLARSILATRIQGNELYLPIDTTVERGYTFTVTASSRYRIEGPPARETYYYQSKYIK